MAQPCGRFAPTPSGELHLGSLLAAVGSYLSARRAGGRWLLRIDDLDPPRVVPGAAAAILRSLEAHGLPWDGEVLWQSRRTDAYRAALDQLRRAGRVYPCACTRRELAAAARAGVDGPVYRGTCRAGLPPGHDARAWRLRVPDADIGFHDAVQGDVCQNLAREVGDFVLQRADGLLAYQLATVVDDAFQGVTEVARGVDLLTSTPRQIHLQHCLGLPQPGYAHLPLLVDRAGLKLGKQTRAAPLDNTAASANLQAVLSALRLPPPADLHGAPPAELLRWAVARWDPARLAGLLAIEATAID
ncbi:MAG: tRNA glutamyl-Q(34) synthetase GluQRS [Pseudomonadota bacterium]